MSNYLGQAVANKSKIEDIERIKRILNILWRFESVGGRIVWYRIA